MTALPNYLKSQRKRSGLSQKDLAFLLGCRSSAHVCRYEHFARAPNLATALELEVILGRPVAELFKGFYARSKKQVKERASLLLRKRNLSRVKRDFLSKLLTSI
jgi:transcriptional regulator with XRE-family HTH domain